MKSTRYVLRTTLGVLLFSVALFGQGSYGRILGTVTDQTGAVLPGATVTVTDTERGLARTLTTDAAGEYNAPTLIPGTYTVRVEAKGFKRLDRENVVIEVGKEVRVDLTPQPGEQAQTVTVTEAIPLVDTATSTLGGALSNAEINDLPLNGRNYQYLLALRPGVMIQPGGSPWSQSTNNVRPDETAWMLDGVINVEFWDARPVGNAPSPLTDAATIIPIDAIQEFNTEENPKAEFGWKPGAVVNVGIRSGTNTLHGSGYAFGRDVDWDARNVFNPGPSNGVCINNPAIPAVCDKLPTQLEQFGGTVGGRIKRDKLFFFGGYEGMRSTVGNVFVFSIPETGGQGTLANPRGDPRNSMVDAIKALQAKNVALSPVSLKLAGCTVGVSVACTGGLFQNASANTTNYDATFPNINVSDNGIGKIDYRINNKHMINGMLWTGDYNANGFDHPIVNELWTSNFLIRTWSTVENWIWTPSSSLVNEVRFGYNRYSSVVIGTDSGILPDGSGGLCTAAGCGGKGFPINTGVTKVGGSPDIRITGFGGGLGNPSSRRPGANAPNPYFDYQDSVSYLRGKHALKFGGEFAHIEADQDTQNFRGRIDFRGKKTPGLTDCNNGKSSCPLEDFFAGNPYQALVNVGDGVRRMTWRKTAAFVQDDWRIKPRLMLNLGLRYEYTSPIKEVNGLWGNFDPALGLVQQGQPSVGDTLWKPDYKNFSPRVGFAWDVTGKGTTVVRGGASMMYSSFVAATFMFNVPAGSHAGGDVGAVPTKACTTVVAPGGTCPQTLGGTIDFGQAKIPGSLLTWNGVVYPQGAGINCAGAASCSVSSVDPNLRTPYIVNYNFGVQHTITSNLSLEVGYVGNHGDNLIGLPEINQCAPNPDGICVRPYAPATATTPAGSACAANAASCFPYLAYINRITNYARSNYNSLQTTLTKRLSHGLNFTAGYTYGHGLDNGSLNRGGGNPQNSRNTNAEYASSDFDIRHRLTVTASYAIPGKKGFGQLLEGWKLNTIVSLQTSQPWGVDDTGDDFSTGGSGNGDLTDRWNFYGNPSDFKSGSSSLPYCRDASTCSVTSGISTIQSFFSPAASKAMWAQCTAVAPDPSTLAQGGCYVSGKSVMTPPKNGTYGTNGRNTFRDSGFKNVDFSLFKDFKFKERFGAQFRIEFFNVFNHPNIANPNGSSNTSQLGWDPSAPGTFGGGGGTPDVAAGNPIIGSGSARDIQLGLKLTF